MPFLELFNCNYSLVDKIAWDSAEPLIERRSPALQHLKRWSLEHEAFIGNFYFFGIIFFIIFRLLSFSIILAVRTRADVNRAGGSFLESAQDGHFFNTFVMYDPLGRIMEKKVRKYRAASM